MANQYNETTRQYIWSAGQKVTTGAASAQSAAIASTEVLVTATAAMYITVAADPTAAAAATNKYMAAGESFHLRLVPGQKIAAIQDTAAGALYIIPVY